MTDSEILIWYEKLEEATTNTDNPQAGIIAHVRWLLSADRSQQLGTHEACRRHSGALLDQQTQLEEKLRELSAKWRRSHDKGMELGAYGESRGRADACKLNADELDATLSSIGIAPRIAATPELIAEWDALTCEGCREGKEIHTLSSGEKVHAYDDVLEVDDWIENSVGCTAKGKEIAETLGEYPNRHRAAGVQAGRPSDKQDGVGSSPTSPTTILSREEKS